MSLGVAFLAQGDQPNETTSDRFPIGGSVRLQCATQEKGAI
jgi:hypothetical protein